MRKIGIVVEYNPLHNGHIYHLGQLNKGSDDIIIAVMSSSVTMRADISIFDKFTKTKQALLAGVDIVCELDYGKCVQRADIFAENAVRILNTMGVDEIIIGSEKNDIKEYERAYELLNDKKLEIANMMKSGISYKKAIASFIDFESNDQLGYAYFKAIKDNNFQISLKTIKRIGDSYDNENPNDAAFTSAKAIRNNIELINKYCPSFVASDKDKILDNKKIFTYLKYQILSHSPAELQKIFMVDEGIENKLADIKGYDNLDGFINYLTSKRYTSTRIKRMLLNVLFGITKEAINNLKYDYVRVLGYSNNGKQYINQIKKNIELYTNIKEGINSDLDIEMKVSKILDSIFDASILKQEQKGPISI